MTERHEPPPVGLRAWLAMIVGPGLVMAATGVGAGDLGTAAVNGAKFGPTLVWIVVVGAVVKFILSEGVARWQHATGTTLVEGWYRHLHPAVGYAFLAYLVIWSFILGGGLASACGLAGHTLAPLGDDAGRSVAMWGAVHMIAGAVLVWFGRYAVFEKVMTVLVAVMFFCTVVGAIVTAPDWLVVLRGTLVPTALPEGSAPFVMAAIGGVGGSVTILSYGYWLAEAGRGDRSWRRATLVDLGVCYAVTALFGICLMVMAAQVFYPPTGDITKGTGLLVRLAEALRERVGDWGYWVFAVGFWGGMFSSVLGVLNGIPYLFSHLIALLRNVPPGQMEAYVSTRSLCYRGYLLYLAIPPLVWLLYARPVRMMLYYTILSSLVTPFIAATLFYMNRKKEWMNELRSSWLGQVGVGGAFLLFGYLVVVAVVRVLG